MARPSWNASGLIECKPPQLNVPDELVFKFSPNVYVINVVVVSVDIFFRCYFCLLGSTANFAVFVPVSVFIIIIVHIVASVISAVVVFCCSFCCLVESKYFGYKSVHNDSGFYSTLKII
ncbi:hypothetical protein Avbf_18169 [Armadillidium vulgare]|nr:hypothetical protein Avbf_18169 [Armadillidium vulgare]